MRALLGAVLTVWLTLLISHPAFAEKRVALVIGNSAYQNVAKLPNPANDATAVVGMFKSAGFDHVEAKFNLAAPATPAMLMATGTPRRRRRSTSSTNTLA